MYRHISTPFLKRAGARYGAAGAATLVAFAARIVLSRLFGDRMEFLLFYPTIMLAATLGGFWPGILSTGLALVLANVWVFPHAGHLNIDSAPDMVGLSVFALMGTFMSGVAELYRRSRQRTSEHEKALALRDSEDRLCMAVESADLGIWDYDPITGELNWSERCKALFGLPPDAHVDYITFLASVGSDYRARAHNMVQAALDPDGDGLFEAEYSVTWPDGNRRWVSAKGKALFGDVNGERRAVRFIGTILDITERRRTIERRRELEAHKREFYNKTIQAATEGRLIVSESEEIERFAGPPLGQWQIASLNDVARARDEARELARQAGMDETRVYDLVGCVVEAAANAAEHAGGGIASLHRLEDSLVFVVTDSGPGIGAMRLPYVALTKGYTTAGTLGMGYKVMIHVADRVYLATGPEGTVVATELKLRSDKNNPAPSRLIAWHE